MRITSRDVEIVFKNFVRALGSDDLALDHNPTYGGYVITNVSGSYHPFGMGRMSAREIYEAMHFAMKVLEYRGEKPRGRSGKHRYGGSR